MRQQLDRSEIIEEIAAETNLTEPQLRLAFDLLAQKIARGLAEQGRVEIHGLGAFSLKTRLPKKGVSPTGQSYSVGKRLSVDFSAEKALRDKVSETRGLPCLP